MTTDDLDNRFDHHPPDEAKIKAHQNMRRVFRFAASAADQAMPDCREKSLAMTALEEAMFWANAGIARLGPDGERLLEGRVSARGASDVDLGPR